MTRRPTRADQSWVEATIVRIERQTSFVLSIFVRADLPNPEAGQHVDIRLTAPDGYQAERSYSIASPPNAPEIELLIERLDEGEVSPYFHEVVQAGDTFEMRGPIGGHFVWTPAYREPVLLVAGGSGAAPLIAIARHHANTGATSPLLLLYSARTWEDIILRDELIALVEASRDMSLGVRFTTTRGASPRAADFQRRIDPTMVIDLLADWDYRPARTYVCGSNDFVDAATEALLAAGLDPATIRTERYG